MNDIAPLRICFYCRSLLADETLHGKPVRLQHVVCQRRLTQLLRMAAVYFGRAIQIHGVADEKVDGGAPLELTPWAKENERWAAQ